MKLFLLFPCVASAFFQNSMPAPLSRFEGKWRLQLTNVTHEFRDIYVDNLNRFPAYSGGKVTLRFLFESENTMKSTTILLHLEVIKCISSFEDYRYPEEDVAISCDVMLLSSLHSSWKIGYFDLPYIYQEQKVYDPPQIFSVVLKDKKFKNISVRLDGNMKYFLTRVHALEDFMNVFFDLTFFLICGLIIFYKFKDMMSRVFFN